jgi:hypothetical protein
MNATRLVKYAGAPIALAICSACSGGAVAPSNAPLGVAYVGRTLSVNGRLVTAARLGAPPRYSTIVPDRRAKSKYFEYVINDYGSYAAIFDYPNSDQQFGTIDDVGGQGCSNVLYGYGKKTFWIVAGADQITEYRVPERPLKTLSVSVGSPSSCAMDTSGDLAVGILSGSGGGDVVIFKNASGSGTVITTPLAREYFDGYDNQGNLFFDGLNDAYNFELLEIPNGTSKVEQISTSNRVEFPGSVQWDGTYLTVTDQGTEEMYQYSVSGTQATLKNTIALKGSSDCAQTWIAAGIVYCADADNEDGEVYDYPAGGSIIAVLGSGFPLPLGTVASEK